MIPIKHLHSPICPATARPPKSCRQQKGELLRLGSLTSFHPTDRCHLGLRIQQLHVVDASMWWRTREEPPSMFCTLSQSFHVQRSNKKTGSWTIWLSVTIKSSQSIKTTCLRLFSQINYMIFYGLITYLKFSSRVSKSNMLRSARVKATNLYLVVFCSVKFDTIDHQILRERLNNWSGIKVD